MNLIRQFDVFNSPAPMRKLYPYIIVLQHDSVPTAGEVIVAPLVEPKFTRPSRLNPLLKAEARPRVLQTPNMAFVPRRTLGEPTANLASSRSRVISAIDILFAGS